MKIFLRISHLYPSIINYFINKYPDYKNKSYKELLNNLHLERFSVSNFYTYELKKLGYKCYEIISNIDFLQKKWLQENNVCAIGTNNILLEQIKYYKPNIIFIGNADLCQKQFIEELRKFKSVEKILAYHCAPFTKKIIDNLKNVDGIVTCTKGYLKKIKLINNQKKLYLPHAFFQFSKNMIKNKKRKIDLTFIGSIFLSQKLHDNRIDFVYQVMKNFNKNSFIAINFSKFFLIKIIWHFFFTLLSFNFFQKFTNLFKIIFIYLKSNKPIFGKDMYKVLENSKIVINKHIEDTKYAGNMRIFETTGSGSLLVSDNKKDLSEFFNINEEIITYKSNTDLIKKCKFFLKNNLHREKISSKGYKKTINKHNYLLRAKKMHNFIQNI